MNQPRDESDEKMEVLGQFLEELHQSTDPESVVHRYSVAHPRWAEDFLEEAVVSRLLTTSRDDRAFPDLRELTEFKILRKIAAGGMGVVFEAEQVALRRRVALKVRHGQSSPEREAGFTREQLVLARLHQSHIVPIFQSGRCGVWQYFAMAFIEGATLHQLLRTAWDLVARGQPVPDLPQLVVAANRREHEIDDSTRLAEYAGLLACRSTRQVRPNETRRNSNRSQSLTPVLLPPSYFRSIAGLIADAAEAVAHAHAANVIHRDIKPSNIMIDRAGQCWLIDFGLADVASPSTEAKVNWSGAAGTPGYIAPEQLQSEDATASVRSDVWALGATLFEAVTLRRPASRTDSIEGIESIPSLVPNAPADLAAICRKASMENPEDRYATAQELACDLRRWLEGRPTLARPVPPWRATSLWARRNKGWAAALGSACLLLVGCAIFLVVQADHRAEQAELRSRTSEALANEEREKANLRERETWLQDVHRMELEEATNDWSDRAWALLRRANELRSDERVRDLAIGTLRGMDAQLVKLFPFGSSSIAFDSSGQKVLIGGLNDKDGKSLRPATEWTIGSERLADSTQTGEGCVAFDSRGDAVQLVSRNGDLVLWSIAGKKATWRTPVPSGKKVDESLTMALSTEASWIAASAELEIGTPQTRIWKATSEVPWLECAFPAEAMAFSDSREFVALADNLHRRIAIYSLKTKELVAELPSGPLPILSLAFGKNPKRSTASLFQHLLAAGDSGGTVHIWDLRSRLPVSHCRGLPREVRALAFHPDGTLLATGGREEVRLWEVASGKPCLRILPSIGIDYVTQLAFSPNGTRLAISSRGVYYTPSTSLWNLSNRRGLCRLPGFTGQIETIVVSPDGKSVAALAQNWELGIWDIESGFLRYSIEVPPGSYADNAGLAFGRDSRTLAYSVSTGRQGTAILIDVANGDELRRWTLPPGLQNHFGFADPDHLWHFQVELENGRALPTSNYAWKEHPRVGRIRNLFSVEATKVTAEVRDFSRGVYRAAMTANGKFTLVEGVGRERSVSCIANASGSITVIHRSTSSSKASGLTLDTTGSEVWFSVSDAANTVRCSIPDGKILDYPSAAAIAANAASGYSCRQVDDNTFGCFLFQEGPGKRLANFALGITINTATFDPTGQRLIWGGRDGSILVCDLPIVRERLNALGLAW